MTKRPSLEEMKFRKKIESLEKDFCKFMNITAIPSYKISIVQQTGTSLAEEKYGHNTYNLYISNILDTYYKNMAKGVIIHEFTHIIDEEELCNKYDYPHTEHNKPFVYKEIHADQIRALYLLGATNIDDINNLETDKTVFEYNRQLYNIYDYLCVTKKGLQDEITVIEKAMEQGEKVYSPVEFSNVLSRIFCYIGTASIFVKYCNNEDINEIRIDDICRFYGFGLDMVYDKVMELPIGYHTQEYVEWLGKIRTDIVVKCKEIINL